MEATTFDDIYFDSIDQTRLSADVNTLVKKVRDALNIRRADYARLAAAIAANVDLSAAGRAKALGELRAATSARIVAEIVPQVQRIVSACNALELRMTPPVVSTDNVVGELRRREIRDHMRRLDPLDIRPALLDAARIGDGEFIEALASDPTRPTVPLATPDVLREARAVLARTRYPAISGEVQETQRVLSAIRLAMSDFERDLAAGSDPIRDAAEGKPATPRIAELALAGVEQ